MTNAPDNLLPLSANDLHILLVLCEADLYGYAILQGVAEESKGRIRPDLGSLYRALARLTQSGLVGDAQSPRAEQPAPGKPRRYYRITELGREVVELESARLRSVLELASARLELIKSSTH